MINSWIYFIFQKTYLWVKKLRGLPQGVMWPAKLVYEQEQNVLVYIKSDNAE